MAIEGELPKPAGVSPGDDVELRPLDEPKSASEGPTLTELAEDYVLFHLTAWYTHGMLKHDVLADYVNEHSDSPRPSIVYIDQPIIAGSLVQPYERHILHAVPKEGWSSLWSFLQQVSGVRRDTRHFWRAFGQEIPVADVVLIARRPAIYPCPTVLVTFLGVDSNKGLYVYDPAVMPPIDQVTRVRRPARPETKAMAKELFSLRPY